MTDPKVILKQEYLNEKGNQERRLGLIQESSPSHILTGKEWYNQQATRSVNQAIGRVIRHNQDYGAIYLVDQRYVYKSNRSQISKWLRDKVKVVDDFHQVDSQLTAFYSAMESRGFKAKVEQIEQIKVEMEDFNMNDSGSGGDRYQARVPKHNYFASKNK